VFAPPSERRGWPVFPLPGDTMAAEKPSAPKAPASATMAQHQAALGESDYPDERDSTDARRGFSASLPEVEIRKPEGGRV